LYVWEGFSHDYTDGLAFAIAESVEEAMKQIEEFQGYEVYTWGKLSTHPLNEKIARCVSGGS
jgi:hypothetical protein